MRYWTLAYWGLGALCITGIWAIQWGPLPSAAGQLLLHLAASAVEAALVTLLLGVRPYPLAGKLTAVLAICVVTGFWADRATPSGAGVLVAHVLWLMLLVVVLAGDLGWNLFTRVLHRERSS